MLCPAPAGWHWAEAEVALGIVYLPGLYDDLQVNEDFFLATQNGVCFPSSFQGSLDDWLLAPKLLEVTLV